MPHLPRFAAVLAVALIAVPAVPAAAGDPTDVPVFGAQVPRGGGAHQAADPIPASAARVIDGEIGDWAGAPTRFGGTSVVSAGELVYQDHLFDAYGADDGRDAERLALLDPAEEAVPETYRLDALMQADVPGQVGLPTPEQLQFDTHYGDLKHQDHADLHEVRIALDGTGLHLLARTTTMTAPDQTAVLVLADTVKGGSPRSIPFTQDLETSEAEYAFLISGSRAWQADLASGAVTELPAGSAATQPADYTNAIEALLPRSTTVAAGKTYTGTGKGGDNGRAFQDKVRLAVVSGTPAASGEPAVQNLANVAFRFDEPAREWFDKKQALALHGKSIDGFFVDVLAADLESGVTQRFVPGPGYHDRLFISDARISEEKGDDGILQHYGVYLPTSYAEGETTPLQWWLHWRGGAAHTAAHLAPRIFKHFGEDVDSVVVSPSGRGSSRWYVGKGHVDFLEVWDDAFATFAIDPNRVYATGHSMGGWGTYLLTTLYPDRFAAGAPVAGPVTQGAWTGADFPGCDQFNWDDNTPCYISANGGRPRDQHTRKLLENLRHVPLAILHGTLDELVPYSGVARQAERLVQLGYRHRFYTFPAYEHYTHPIADQWSEAAEYEHRFTRDPNPARVTYKRDMPFELATEQVQSDGVAFDFNFDRAYWMSELTPANLTTGVASFDGRSLALGDPTVTALPDVGGPAAPGQTGPYAFTGLQWLLGEPAARSNGFEATLRGAAAAKLDVARMSLSTAAPITGKVDSNQALELRLAGDWTTAPAVSVDGNPVAATLVDGVLIVPVPQGAHTLVIG